MVAGKHNKDKTMKINIPYWGIDNRTGGWFCVGLGKNNECAYFPTPNIEIAHWQIKDRGGKIALIDMPIGFPNGKAARVCDQKARRFIGPRSSSVFSVPCREAIEAYKSGVGKKDKVEKGKSESRRVARGPLSKQTWDIADKMAEVDDFVHNNYAILREVHPEVCFRALNDNEYLADHKTTMQGAKKRLEICSRYFADASQLLANARLCKGAKDDDVLDALAAAITAKLGATNGYETLPDNPPKDSTGLPMEMVYVVAAPTR